MINLIVKRIRRIDHHILHAGQLCVELIQLSEQFRLPRGNLLQPRDGIVAVNRESQRMLWAM